MATEPNYEEINEGKREAELEKRESELESLEISERQLSKFDDSKNDRIQYLRQEITALKNPDRNVAHKVLYEMEVSSLKKKRTSLETKLNGRRVDPSNERKWKSELIKVNEKIKEFNKQYTYLIQQKPKDEISNRLDQLLESGTQKMKYYGKENQKTDELLTEIAKYQGNVPEKLYNQLEAIVTKGQSELLEGVKQLSENGVVKINNLDKSFEKTETTDNILSNAEKYKKNCVAMVNKFSQQNYVVKDALKYYGEHVKESSIANSASMKAITFVSRLQKAVKEREQTSNKIEMPDKNNQKKDQTFYQEVPILSGQGTTKDQESFTQASNPSVSGRVNLVSNDFDARETSTDVVKEDVAVKVPESQRIPKEVKEQEAPSKRRDTLYAKVNGQVITDETGQSKNDKEIFRLNSYISDIKTNLGKATSQRQVFTDRGKTLIGRIRNFFSKGTIKRLDNTINSCKEKIESKQNELARLQNPTDRSKEKPQQSFEQVTDRSKEVSKDKSNHKPQAKARNKKEVVTELA